MPPKKTDPSPILEALDAGRQGLAAAARDLRHHLETVSELAARFRGLGNELRAGADRLESLVARVETVVERVEGLEARAQASEQTPAEG